MIRINIARPYPGTNENKEQIEWIEPLRKETRIFVSSAYLWNLDSYQKGEMCSYSSGYKYVFAFPNHEDATAFQLKFNGQILDD